MVSSTTAGEYGHAQTGLIQASTCGLTINRRLVGEISERGLTTVLLTIRLIIANNKAPHAFIVAEKMGTGGISCRMLLAFYC